METTGIFVPTPPVVLDGASHSVEIRLPDWAPQPTEITAAYVVLHTGTVPILEIGGFFTLFVARATGPVLLCSAMNRHGAARWTHDPPVVVERGERILLTYGGQVAPLRAFDALFRRWVEYRLQATIQPDVGLFWITDSCHRCQHR